MEFSLGSLLRQLRRGRRSSQAQVAQQAGLGRSTLAQWENGTRRPHASDLNTLLRALQASPEQHQRAQELLQAERLVVTRSPRTAHTIIQLNAPSSIGPLPHHGDLLRALRMRRGLSQSDTARRVGVTERTLRRWENSDVWPSNAQIHTLCYILGAEPAEMAALAIAIPSAITEKQAYSTTTTPYELVEQARGVYHQWEQYSQPELKELNLFRLECLAWSHANHSEAGRCALAQIYSFHAAFLSTNERWSEAALYANRALDLWPSLKAPQDVLVLAALAAARAAVYRGRRPAPHKGIEVLRHWIDVTPWPDYRGWLLGELAKYTTLAGDSQTGLSLVQQAQDVAALYWNWVDEAYRAVDYAQILIWTGQHTQALQIIENTYAILPGESLLLEVEAWLNQGHPSKAQERLENIWPGIQANSHSHVRAQMRKLELNLLQT